MPSIRRFWRRLKAGPKFDLPYILARANPSDSFADRVEFCERLLDWIRYTGDGKTTVAARMRFLLQLLERKPEWKKSSGAVIRSVVEKSIPYRAFFETGVPHGQTFTKEIATRVFQILLPVAEESEELYSILSRVFYDSEDPDWIESLPAETWKEVIDGWIFPEAIRLPQYEKALADAALALCVQGAALSLRTDFVTRSPEFGFEAHPFLHLEAHLAVLSAQARRDPKVRDRKETLEAVDGIAREIERARALIRSVRGHLEEYGVSVDLVYQMDRMKLYLERIGFLVIALSAIICEPAQSRHESLLLFKNLVAGLRYDEDFRYVLRKGLRLLSTKIVERTGQSGERYFTSNWDDWKHLYWAAAGGGALTALTAMMKSFTPHDPPFAELLVSACNYAGSFALMHVMGLKLATKQPSMTAAALADRLTGADQAQEEAFSEEVARIARAQFAAVLGNLTLVVPSVLVIDSLWTASHGTHFYNAAKAEAAISSVALLGSGTLWYATLTGGILWISSIGAGFVENFVVLTHLPELVAGHRVLKQIFGAERMKKFAATILRNTSGLAGSIILGVLLAATPVFGHFFGLPVDARHVTLTTGTLTFSFLGLGSLHGVLYALASVMLIGSLNFGVSFFLAILVAFRARGIDLQRGFRLLGLSAKKFLMKPWTFLFPVREEKAE